MYIRYSREITIHTVIYDVYTVLANPTYDNTVHTLTIALRTKHRIMNTRCYARLLLVIWKFLLASSLQMCFHAGPACVYPAAGQGGRERHEKVHR